MQNLAKWTIKNNSAQYLDKDTNTFYKVDLCQMYDGMIVPYEVHGNILPCELLTKLKKIILGGSVTNERTRNKGHITETRSGALYGAKTRRTYYKKN